MMRFRLDALLLSLGFWGLAGSASALTLPVIGGPGLDQGVVCASGSCPGTPVLSLTAPAAATGSFTYNAGPSTVDLTLTLTQDADFGGTTQLLAGTTFSASGIPVMTFPTGGSTFQIIQLGAATGLVSPLNLVVAGGATVLADTPAVSGLTCFVGTGSDQCGVSFGPSGFSYNATTSGNDFDAFVTFNVNVVPEPGTLMTLAFGIAGLSLAARRRIT